MLKRFAPFYKLIILTFYHIVPFYLFLRFRILWKLKEKEINTKKKNGQGCGRRRRKNADRMKKSENKAGREKRAKKNRKI